MKVLIIFSCLSAVCFALPSKRLSGHNVGEAVKITADMVDKNEVAKRSKNALQMAFDWTDGNRDGHITAAEFASYYVNNWPQFRLTRTQWIKAFGKAVPKFDSNDNGTLEINEYAKLAKSGGYGE